MRLPCASGFAGVAVWYERDDCRKAWRKVFCCWEANALRSGVACLLIVCFVDVLACAWKLRKVLEKFDFGTSFAMVKTSAKGRRNMNAMVVMREMEQMCNKVRTVDLHTVERQATGLYVTSEVSGRGAIWIIESAILCGLGGSVRLWKLPSHVQTVGTDDSTTRLLKA